MMRGAMAGLVLVTGDQSQKVLWHFTGLSASVRLNAEEKVNPVLPSILPPIEKSPDRPDAVPAEGLKARRQSAARTVVALVLREMSTTYGRSPGGYLWAVAEPVATVAILSFAFSLILRAPSLGTNLPLFFATGYLPFALFQTVSRNVGQSIRFSRSLLAYPAVTFADAIFARLILAMLTEFAIWVFVLVGIHLIFDLRSILDIGGIFLAFILASGLGFGIGVMNCYLTAAYPVWERIWAVVTRPLFLISGVFFTYDSMPQYISDVLWYNPILQIVGLMRKGFYASYDSHYVSVTYVAGVALACGLFGFLLLYRHHRTILNA